MRDNIESLRIGFSHEKDFRWEKALEKIGSSLVDIQETMLLMGYEERKDQENIMWDIIDALEEKENLLIEAGVGIGKSFAYLIPGVLLSMYYGQPLIVATSSIHLTEQLAEDIKVVERILEKYLDGSEVEVVVAKGRDNYPCSCTLEKKIKKLIGHNRDPGAYQNIYSKLDLGLDRQNPMGIAPSYWNEITEHTCDTTPNYHLTKCPLYKMRTSLRSNQQKHNKRLVTFVPKVLIVNQNFLIAHYNKQMNSKHGLLPDKYSLLVIDEVHKLEEVVRDSLTKSIDMKFVDKLLKEINNYLYQGAVNFRFVKDIGLTRDALTEFFDDIHENLKINGELPGEDYDRLKISHTLSTKRLDTIIFKLKELENYVDIHSVSNAMDNYNSDASDRQLDNLFDKLHMLQTFINACNGKNKELIIWGKVWNKMESFSVSYCPDNVDEKIREDLFSGDIPTICLSATITMNDSYEYISRNIGFNGNTSEIYPSPFYYNKSRLYIPEDLPQYNNRDSVYFDEIAQHILNISDKLIGGTLVLFTAKNDLTEVSLRLRGKVNKEIHIGLKSEDTKLIIDKFKSDKGIILGTGSFWEGIDLKGDILTHLVIVRLPFPTPDPVIDRKIEKFSQSEVIVPEMLTKLRQGTGRLIRTMSDIGVCTILDSRINKQDYRYRKVIVDAIPIKKIITSHDELIEFVEINQL